MAAPRPLLMLALLAWAALADQGAGGCWWPVGIMQGGQERAGLGCAN